MDIVTFKRNQEQHKLHIERIRKITPVIDTSTPESLGLKHLAFRPKKMQLINDQKQRIAKDNAIMMELMTKRMTEKREQPKYIKLQSLNEVERKIQVERLNSENALMMQRLKTTPSVINVAQLEKDFQKHLHAESVLRRRQMKPLAMPKLHKVHDKTNTFDAASYMSQFDANTIATNEESINNNNSIKSMADFRKHVITTKKLQNSDSTLNLNNNKNKHMESSNDDNIVFQMTKL